MKSPVVGPGTRVQDARRSRTSRGSAGSGFATHLHTDAPAEPAAINPTPDLMDLSAILALQEAVGDTAEDRKRPQLQYSETILDRLEQLRSDLLLGRVTNSQLIALAQQLRIRPPSTGIAGLDTILGEIELRAEVEIAKRMPNRSAAGEAPAVASD